MTVKNIRAILKKRYRLSSRTQLSFELCFPNYLIGKCRFTANNGNQIRTQKVTLLLKGIVFSDTIPMSWFTSSALIPWAKVQKMAISDAIPSIDGTLDPPVSSQSNKQPVAFEYCTLRIDDPQEITIDLPWSKAFTDYVRDNKLFDI